MIDYILVTVGACLMMFAGGLVCGMCFLNAPVYTIVAGVAYMAGIGLFLRDSIIKIIRKK